MYMKLINTQIAFGGFYESQHDANIENITDNYFDDVSYEDNNFVDYFNWTAIHNNYIKLWVDKFEDYLKNNYNIKTLTKIFEDVKLWSPKYYNYTTDHIDCKIYKRYAVQLHKFNEDKFYELAEDAYGIDIDLTEAGKKKLNEIQVEVNRPDNPNQLSFNF